MRGKGVWPRYTVVLHRVVVAVVVVTPSFVAARSSRLSGRPLAPALRLASSRPQLRAWVPSSSSSLSSLFVIDHLRSDPRAAGGRRAFPWSSLSSCSASASPRLVCIIVVPSFVLSSSSLVVALPRLLAVVIRFLVWSPSASGPRARHPRIPNPVSSWPRSPSALSLSRPDCHVVVVLLSIRVRRQAHTILPASRESQWRPAGAGSALSSSRRRHQQF